MKADPSWGEIVSAGRLGIGVEQVGLDHWVRKGKVTADDLRAAAAGFGRARELVASGEYDLVVLDELITALFFELVPLRRRAAPCWPPSRPTSSSCSPGGGRPTRSWRPPTSSPRCGPLKHYYDAGVGAARASSTRRVAAEARLRGCDGVG